MLVISIPDTEVYERGEEGFYTNTEVLSKEKKKKTIIKNVSTRRNLNVDPWANHECRLFLFLKNNPIWGGGWRGDLNSSISQRTTLAGCHKT